jgi:7-cyano-7-deazaguanine synthase in queuosine biosynthesis
VIVAFSGGKDSAFAASCLKAIGYKCTLAAVDMEYSPNWRTGLEQIASARDLPLQILSIRNREFQAQLSQEERKVVDVNLEVLRLFNPHRLTEGNGTAQQAKGRLFLGVEISRKIIGTLQEWRLVRQLPLTKSE